MSDNQSNWNALRKIIARLPAHLAYYGSALGAIVIVGSGAEGMASIVGNIGAGLLGNLIADIAKGKEIPDEDIRRRAEEAVTKSDIATLLTKHDFLQIYARLIHRLDTQKSISREILDELRTGFSQVATAEQMEEVKELLLQALEDKKPPQKPRVFISYRRKDATEFAQRLHDALEATDVDAWLDVRDMPSGDTFIAQIDRAIAAADYFLLVATPQAIESDYCRDEWKKALEHYKPIIPLLCMGTYADLPKEAFVYLNDARDFRDESHWEEQVIHLLKQVRIAPSQPGPYFGVPRLPAHYLTRPQLLDDLRHALTGHKTTVLTSPSQTIGVHGMGGVGKSVLAAAISRDYFVRRTFKDGIFWLTFGTSPNVADLWKTMAQYLGYQGKSFGKWEDARDFFESETRDKECLLILDDLWDSHHADAFLRLGDKCRIFATSRNADLLPEIGAKSYAIGLLSVPESEQLLKQVTERESLPAQANAMIERCGNLPLALAMIGAMVKGKREQAWEDALADLKAQDLEEIRARFPEYPHPNLFAALQVSIEALDEELRERYADFAIFPDDVGIPEEVPITFWKPLEGRKVRRKLDELVSRNLLIRADDGSLSLHDLQLSYLRRTVTDIPQRNQRLLHQYNPNGAAWQNVCDEYLWKRLVYHLAEAKRYSDVLQTVDKPFIAAKMRLLQSFSAIFDDLRIAISVAEAVGNFNRMLGFALVYSSFRANIAQLGSSEAIPLYARFGKVELALEFAGAIEDPNKQAEMLVKIAKEISIVDIVRARQLVQQVLNHWKEYESGYTFGQIVSQIFEVFPEEIVSFLERVQEFAPIHSLGQASSGIAYEQIENLAPQLSTELQTRLVNILTQRLAGAKSEHLENDLRSLLARIIPDPRAARHFAHDKVSQLIVAAKEHIIQRGDTPLPQELIEQTTNVFIQEATQDEKDVLYRYIISPYFQAFYFFISTTNLPIGTWETQNRVRLFLDLIYRLIKIDGNLEEAQKLLFEALDLNETLKGLDATITKNSYPGTFKLILERMVEGFAAHNLSTALEFLKLPNITQVLHEGEADRLPVRAIAAASQTQAQDALRAAETLGFRQREWARAFVAEGLAQSDLAQAISIWKGLDANVVNKPEMLIAILRNASLKDYLLAQKALFEEFRPEQARQVYKVPVLLDIAMRCHTADPNKAQAIGEEVRECLYRLEHEKQGKVLQEFFILPLIRPIVMAGLFDLAWGWARSISDDSGLEAVACAEILEVLSKNPLVRNEESHRYIPILLSQVTNARNHGRGSTGGFSDLILDFAENLQHKDETNLVSIYLQTYSGRHRRVLD